MEISLTKKSNTNLNLIESEILYEDNHLIIINKKTGVLVQGDMTGDLSLIEIVKDYLKKNGIETRIHYPIAIHHQKIFIKTFGKIKLPNTERLSKEIISLPIYPELDFKKVKFIIKMINQFFSYKFKNNLN